MRDRASNWVGNISGMFSSCSTHRRAVALLDRLRVQYKAGVVSGGETVIPAADVETALQTAFSISRFGSRYGW